MTSLTPKEIVKELDRFIIGQEEAKKSVALALRNRWRRRQLPPDLREEILPKNILMIGPTGVGKTEIARRLAKLSGAPFIKVEATKFTEVGYVGRDVEQIVRDLMEISISCSRDRQKKEVFEKAGLSAEERLLDALQYQISRTDILEKSREEYRQDLRTGKWDDKEVEIQLTDQGNNPFSSFEIPGMPGAQMGMLNLGDMFSKTFGQKMKTRKVKVKEALKLLIEEESDKLLDQEKLIHEALSNVEEQGIVFLDEIDKICGRNGRHGADVSREGVQRDLLPLIEGTTVSTKYGPVKTDHILFIASGAFHVARPSDLLPELQGRLPIRVELQELNQQDLLKILTEPEGSLIKQYVALLSTENVQLNFTPEALEEIAKAATEVNQNVENIGARRLQTIMEKLLEEISYHASEKSGEKIIIDRDYVHKTLDNLIENTDLSKFIL